VELHTISFHNKSHYEEQIEAWNFLSKLDSVRNGTGDDPIQDMGKRQRHDLVWRANHLGKRLDFWDMVRADFPYLLTERLVGQLSPRNRKLRNLIGTPPEQAISANSIFNNAMLMISPLREFHRSDGMSSLSV